MTVREEHTRSIAETAPGLWTLGHIDAQPAVVLRDWKCFELTLPGKATTRRFLGRNGQSSSIYTSDPAIKFDPVQFVGEATDGAVIRLAGPPSCDSLDAHGYIKDVSDGIRCIEPPAAIPIKTSTLREQILANRQWGFFIHNTFLPKGFSTTSPEAFIESNFSD